MIIRRQREGDAGDLASVLHVTREAFGATDLEEGGVVANLVSALQASDAYAGLSYVAEADGAVVGHVMLTRSWVDASRALVDVLVLSPLSVLPAHQGRGIGGALVARAIAEADLAAAPAVFLEGDPAYYGRLGFSAAGPRGFGRPSERIPEAAFQVVVLPAFEDWMTGRLVYSDRFWALDCVGLR